MPNGAGPGREGIRELTSKYKQRLSSEFNIAETPTQNVRHIFSREYKQFKEEYLPKRMDLYEKACNFSEKLLKMNPDKKEAAKLEEAIKISHLSMAPSGAVSFSILAPIAVILLGSLLGYGLPIFLGAGEGSLFLIGFFVITGIVLFFTLKKVPFFFADSWRMKASNQMVQCVFYIVTFMRHTSNLELALEFAAEHLTPPLSLDLKKILWDVETGKYESVKESLDNYLETWKEWNVEFIEAIHLIESSLYEPSESRRLELLDKSLDVILSETYEKMLHYAHNLKSPITMINMLGVILPVLGLVILPLAINFMTDENGVSLVKWYHISVIYNFALPVGVYFLVKSVLSKRPTGYGGSEISDRSRGGVKYKEINLLGVKIRVDPVVISVFIGMVFLMLGISPVILHLIGAPDIGINLLVEDESTTCKKQFCLLDYKEIEGQDGSTTTAGPYGLGATLLSIFVVLSLSVSIGFYYSLKSKDVIKIREDSKKLENEFASALFQLGNRLGDGLPAEIAFEKVAAVMQDSASGRFFNLVSSNIRRLGMSVSEAIFNPRMGAIVYFPSNLVESSMKVLTQSVKKGPGIAAQALVNVSRYIKEIHTVNERLKDLMGEVISSIKSQISFLTPVIAGIVIGITSMIASIMSKLAASQKKFTESIGGEGTAESLGGLAKLMGGQGIPTYYFQIIVGIYVVQIIYILTIMANGIENGEDKLAERYSLGKNLLKSVTLYCFIAAAVIIIFNLVASQIVGVVGGI